MTVAEVRQRYLNFFKERGHVEIPSASLVPENDPTTLFTGSGMQPLLPYLLGAQHPEGSRLVNSQKCFRAEDIEEVGDNRHTTFFEMLGNWSLGDYFKEEQLPWFFDFLTNAEAGLGLDPEKLYVTVFAGDEQNNIPQDEETVAIWQRLFKEKGMEARTAFIGSEEDGYRKGMQGGRIFYYDASKNWWSRAGGPENIPAGEPGGPDSEVFYDFGSTASSGQARHDPSYGEHCHPNCDCGRFMEIGNSVFMEYLKTESGFDKLPQKNVDFGGGLERLAAATIDSPDVFHIDVLQTLIRKIEEFSEKSYDDTEYTHAFRVIADHMRAAIFMIGDGVLPSNTEQGYFVRRLIRRSVMKIRTFSSPEFFALGALAHPVAAVYKEAYPILSEKADYIAKVITEEETKFRQTLGLGVKEFERIAKSGDLSGKDAFILFSTYGFPLELTRELAQEKGISVDTDAFYEEFEKHRAESRRGAEQKFKGGLADTNDQTTRLHTATHLLLAGLRKHLGDEVHQAGSNITAERTRFDFTHPEKVGRETLDRVEKYVNDAIAAGAERTIEQMQKEEAQASGVEGSFWERYPDTVDVYVFKDASGIVWSRELCGGPHVSNTADIGEGNKRFKITKEEAVSSGVRRVRGELV